MMNDRRDARSRVSHQFTIEDLLSTLSTNLAYPDWASFIAVVLIRRSSGIILETVDRGKKFANSH
jgi:hypothetical protein